LSRPRQPTPDVEISWHLDLFTGDLAAFDNAKELIVVILVRHAPNQAKRWNCNIGILSSQPSHQPPIDIDGLDLILPGGNNADAQNVGDGGVRRAVEAFWRRRLDRVFDDP